MADNSDVVGRIDSLMKRRRSFVAAPANRPQIPETALTPIEDDDLPVLTEVLPAAVSAEPGEHGNDFKDFDDFNDFENFDETQASLLASDLADAIGQQLTAELPRLLEAALLNATEELRGGVEAIIETALNDFIARHKPMPLDEPGAQE
jgi:hypothetical protein